MQLSTDTFFHCQEQGSSQVDNTGSYKKAAVMPQLGESVFKLTTGKIQNRHATGMKTAMMMTETEG